VTYLPMILFSLALLGLVALMAGDREKGLAAVRNIAIVVVGMIILVVLFSIAVDRTL
jgi:hypothetical protein